MKSNRVNNTLNKIRLFRNSKKGSYFILKRILGFYPNQIAIYEQALVHKSFNSNEKEDLPNNERLEFLGDAILGAIVTEIVYEKYPGEDEGFLTNTRSKIISRDSLDRISKALGLDSLLLSSSFSEKNHVLGNALEALIGAIYLDKGYKKATLFVKEKIIRPYVDFDELAKNNKNAKSQLLEWGQQHKISVEFNLIGSSQKGKKTYFETEVLINNVVVSSGKGSSKKIAQQEAAQIALERIENGDFVLGKDSVE